MLPFSYLSKDSKSSIYSISFKTFLFTLGLMLLDCDFSHTVLFYSYPLGRGQGKFSGYEAIQWKCLGRETVSRFPEKGNSPEPSLGRQWRKDVPVSSRAQLLGHRSHFILRKWDAPHRTEPLPVFYNTKDLLIALL